MRAKSRAWKSVVAGFILLIAPSIVLAGWGLGLMTDPADGTGNVINIASFAGSTDGLDLEPIEQPDYSQPMANILIRHQQYVNGWNAGTDWYSGDFRNEIPLGTSKTFSDFYIWANPGYMGNVIPVKWYWYIGQPDPRRWTFTLRLLQTPQGIAYNGPVSWMLTPNAGKTSPQLLTELPVYFTSDGLNGYRFSLTASHLIPEPSGLAAMLSAVMVFGAGIKRRR